MKYLRKFIQFESVDNKDLRDLQQFCNDYLGYLIDDGFNVDIVYIDKHNYYEIGIDKGDIDFAYSEIENSLLPFIEVLLQNYKSTKVLPDVFIIPAYDDDGFEYEEEADEEEYEEDFYDEDEYLEDEEEYDGYDETEDYSFSDMKKLSDDERLFSAIYLRVKTMNS